ncbi:MAG: hypothetical protein JRH20_16005 [Deltaproteobacteria bacterium]|nr:hypothetical protein [Deltaproteobacteria bacterium]
MITKVPALMRLLTSGPNSVKEERLFAIIPPPQWHLARYHGVFSGHDPHMKSYPHQLSRLHSPFQLRTLHGRRHIWRDCHFHNARRTGVNTSYLEDGSSSPPEPVSTRPMLTSP